MSKQPLFFEPIFKDRIWGGQRLTSFGYDIPSSRTGECWAFAAHRNGESIVKSGEFKGLTLGQLWKDHPHLFGNLKGDRFPLLTKILDATQNLSVQVHPDDNYALDNEGDLGKNECWYIIDCDEGAEIIYGHTAQTKEEFQRMVVEGKWDTLLRKIPVRPGDFFFVPSGTIHAIGAGIIILETQQNSDTTYRVYDYDRRDHNGNLRELHPSQSIAVTKVPSEEPKKTHFHKRDGDMIITTFVECDYFNMHKWELQGTVNITEKDFFLLVSVISGAGLIKQNDESYRFKKGDHFMLPSGYGDFEIYGKVELIVTHL
ncbi:mannose-6-phosphate isomerase, class I [Robertmurraya korlensis]|uniref:mannose-6-phosphate isomerase, class I n=1 Tax=Robertmurraya korlensis TaxID=519977 RepID=UPI002041D43F|nr:mannose-6-phosphate isomerase, class I [Robertmurraya korlensis]MCM3601713.1 mannose-6-phosphate isomerase, class I [Robertmurraya korlensis]